MANSQIIIACHKNGVKPMNWLSFTVNWPSFTVNWPSFTVNWPSFTVNWPSFTVNWPSFHPCKNRAFFLDRSPSSSFSRSGHQETTEVVTTSAFAFTPSAQKDDYPPEISNLQSEGEFRISE